MYTPPILDPRLDRQVVSSLIKSLLMQALGWSSKATQVGVRKELIRLAKYDKQLLDLKLENKHGKNCDPAKIAARGDKLPGHLDKYDFISFLVMAEVGPPLLALSADVDNATKKIEWCRALVSQQVKDREADRILDRNRFFINLVVVGLVGILVLSMILVLFKLP